MAAPPRPRSQFSPGPIEATVIPEGLAYAGALRTLVRDAARLHVRVDVATVYSEVPVELHDYVDTITYRFLTDGGVPILAYLVSTHSGGSYAEVRYDGTYVRGWPDGLGLSRGEDQETLRRQDGRMYETLAVGQPPPGTERGS
jgi:hypothetical protein